MKQVIETEASRLMKRTAARLLDIQFTAKRASYEPRNRYADREGDCPHTERAIQASMASDDVVTACAWHLTDERLGIPRVDVRPYMTDETVRGVIVELNSKLEALEFKDYPGGVEGARRDEMRGRLVVLHNQGDKARDAEVRDALTRAAAFDWSKEPSMQRRIKDLAKRLEIAT